MKKTVIFATGNQDKMREVRAIMGEGYEMISTKEAGISVDVEENGASFAENALIKARAVAACTDLPVLADDSGLVVDALGGEPGIYSARYMGEDTSYEIKNRAIIDRLAGLEGEARSARFTCVIAGVFPDGTELTAEGHMEGRIAFEPAGSGGFGYDPILFLPEYGMTSAEISAEEKNAISHRGKALRTMRVLMEERFS